jgi:hypothetical protein
MPNLTPREVFEAGGVPKWTYNPRISRHLEDRLAPNTWPSKFVMMTGPTRAGKTVLAQRVLSSDSIWVFGGQVRTEDDFWSHVITQLNAFHTVTREDSSEKTATATGGLEAQASLFVVKGKGVTTAQYASARRSRVSETRTTPAHVQAVRALENTRRTLVVDDFHYLTHSVQRGIVRALKSLVFKGLRVLLIAVPHRRDDVSKVEREMVGRVTRVDVPPWSLDELEYISTVGFRHLESALSPRAARRLAYRAIGSPQLMQEFCLATCALNQGPLPRELALDDSAVDAVLREVSLRIGNAVNDRLVVRAPDTRRRLREYDLPNGFRVDIGRLVLHALAYTLQSDLRRLEQVDIEGSNARPRTTVTYADLLGTIRTLTQSDRPRSRDIHQLLRRLSNTSASQDSSAPVIEFDEVERSLHITDPFFAFNLLWAQIEDLRER